MKKIKFEPKILVIPILIVLNIALFIGVYDMCVDYVDATGTVYVDDEGVHVFFGMESSIPIDMPLPAKYTFSDKDKVTCHIKKVRMMGDTVSYKIISVEKRTE